jgi:phage terminase small subunit
MSRTPDPAELRVLRGNRHRSPEQPRPGPLSPNTPDELTDAAARAEWQRVVPGLIACGQVTVMDRACVIGYCVLWAEWLKLQAAGGMHRESANQAFRLLLLAAGELGCTPTKRGRVRLPPAAKRTTWDDVLA